MNKQGFTMAEILLSLTIIGVVAAITLPSLTGNINERTWNTQRKALYARFSQAIALMPALNGYGYYKEETSSASATDTCTETFITAGLAKVIKINNICDNEHLEDCGIPSKITTFGGNVINDFANTYNTFSALNSVIFTSSQGLISNTKVAAFETVNGESILTYYNPNCISSNENWTGYPTKYICANFIYDLNGTKGPNTVGKDIGYITTLYSTDSLVVAPLPILSQNANNNFYTRWSNASKKCTEQNENGRLPNIDELTAMAVNGKLIDLGTSVGTLNIWSSNVYSGNSQYAWRIYASNGHRGYISKNDNGYVRCVKR